ncbi:hypothetical protein BDQ12DRAFT_351331 [Crucibulum laeve]|uniref:Uncharacterized protein n=1 Tax=Crucibulum laeve TaxID=68775 RepID=A0A5C3MLK5_9AGAR|nr:hypothetical protein BDQ12DRAFT_351331 [Crucibulum laeve]
MRGRSSCRRCASDGLIWLLGSDEGFSIVLLMGLYMLLSSRNRRTNRVQGDDYFWASPCLDREVQWRAAPRVHGKCQLDLDLLATAFFVFKRSHKYG